MRGFLTLLLILLAIFAGQSMARTVYIHATEFLPAKAEWEAAHDRRDMDAMQAAYEKELRAAGRSRDPFWFYR